jgi:hypothetical protein
MEGLRAVSTSHRAGEVARLQNEIGLLNDAAAADKTRHETAVAELMAAKTAELTESKRVWDSETASRTQQEVAAAVSAAQEEHEKKQAAILVASQEKDAELVSVRARLELLEGYIVELHQTGEEAKCILQTSQDQLGASEVKSAALQQERDESRRDLQAALVTIATLEGDLAALSLTVADLGNRNIALETQLLTARQVQMEHEQAFVGFLSVG